MSNQDIIFEVRSSQLVNLFYFIGQTVFLVALLVYAKEIEGFLFQGLAWLNNSVMPNPEPADTVKLVSMGSMGVLLLIPGFMIVWRYLDTHMRTYTFRSDRLVFEFGVLNRGKDNVEYYRVKDFYSDAPFWMRPFGLNNFHLISTDRRTPFLTVPGIKELPQHEDKIRDAIETLTSTGRGQEIDIV